MHKYISTQPIILFLSFLILSCQAATDSNSKETIISNELPSAGKSWDFINEHGARVEWRNVESHTNNGNIALFKQHFKNADGSRTVSLIEVLFETNDHVSITQKNAKGIPECQYTGHIWTEASLEDYDSFSEDPMPENRPVFYRIVTGTYNCEGMKEPETWIAKINE